MNFGLEEYLRIWKIIDRRKKFLFFLIVFLTLIVSILELIGIGATYPYLKTLLEPNHTINLLNRFGISIDKKNIIITVTILFLTLILFSTYARLKLLRLNISYSHEVGLILNERIFKKLLNQTYLKTAEKGGNVYINSMIVNTDSMVSGILIPTFTLINSVIMIVFYCLLLLFMSSGVAILFVLILFLTYLSINLRTRNTLKGYSRTIASESKNIIDILQNTIGGMRDIILGNLQKYYYDEYTGYERKLREAKGSVTIIASSARYFAEGVGTVIIIIMLYVFYVKSSGIESYLPEFGLLIIISQKILPFMQHIHAARAGIKSNTESSLQVLALIDTHQQSFEHNAAIINFEFQNSIELKDVAFRYPGAENFVFKNINLCINKNETIGIIGKSGEGKSTLLDLIMGLIHPSNGELRVDGLNITNKNVRSWYQKISHVSQVNHIYNKSLRENIVLDRLDDDFSNEEFNQSIENACLKNFVNELPHHEDTMLYQNGMNLSGGQRQRIALARALYRNKQVLILDEATSALDPQNESNVMSNIYKMVSLTKIIVSHKIELLCNCDRIFEINNGIIRNVK